MKRALKDFNYQLDLTAFISLLSVCICFLLLTVAWFQLGSIGMRQLVGGQSDQQASKGKPEASLWLQLTPKQDIKIRLKHAGSKKQELFLSKNGFDYSRLQAYLKQTKQKLPALQQAFIFPSKDTSYQDVIRVMDTLRQASIYDLGISPL